MATRREFLVYTTSAASLGGIVLSKSTARTMASGNIVVVDKSIPKISELSDQFFGGDASFVEYSGDTIDIWADQLLPLLKPPSSTVGGITLGQDAFALGEIARDLGIGFLSCYCIASNQIAESAVDRLSLTNPDYFAWTLGQTGVKFR